MKNAIRRAVLGFAAAQMLSLAPAALAANLTAADWAKLEPEVLKHYQAVLRIDTSDPPGNEKPLTEYLVKALEAEGIPVKTFALEPHRPNVVARLKGNGKKRPLLIMGHQDTVNVDPAKWKFPPFSATRDGGYIYARGTVDDKDNLTAGLMIMLLLKRNAVALDRDVIFLAESGEEGSVRVGIKYMVENHYPEIEAEYCLAEGGAVTRIGGQVRYGGVQTTEKIPRRIELAARGTSGHASMPLVDNPVVKLSQAVTKVAAWRPPMALNETTTNYFSRLANLSPPAEAARYRAIIEGGAKAEEAREHFRLNEPMHNAILSSTISPTMVDAGYLINVIPSEAKAQLDTRLLPDEDPERFLALVRDVVGDPAVTVAWAPRDTRPGGPAASLEAEPFKIIETAMRDIYKTPVLPQMATGATDMAYVRAKGMQCYGIGAGTDVEDIPLGYGVHSDQERLLESELYRFVRFHWQAAYEIARAR
jgi:acetylornithine deacetylase/succinyl-diaminopimelate desuccinylase-like protein